MEAELAVRKAGRTAGTEADGLANRLAEIDIHQREARYLLERAGNVSSVAGSERSLGRTPGRRRIRRRPDPG